MALKFIYGEPAVAWKDSLVIADLHIGKKGLPNWRMHAKVIRRMMDSQGLKKLIIAGDVKHKIGGTEGDVGKFIRDIGSEYELHIVKGNHDGNIQKYADYAHIYEAEGAVFDGLGVFHGHAWPSKQVIKQSTVVMGHLHPHAPSNEERKLLEKAFLIGELSSERMKKAYNCNIRKNVKIVVLPAFSEPYARMGESSKIIAPIMKDIFIKRSAKIYLLNGIRIV